MSKPTELQVRALNVLKDNGWWMRESYLLFHHKIKNVTLQGLRRRRLIEHMWDTSGTWDESAWRYTPIPEDASDG